MGYRITFLVLICAIIPNYSFLEPQHTAHHSHSGGGGGGGKENTSKGIPKQVLENWSSNFGGQLYQFGVSVTKYNDLERRFATAPGADVQRINLQSLIVEMVNDINTNLNEKVQAVRKIMDWAESRALEFYEKKPENRPSPPKTYYNSRKLNMGNDPDKLMHNVEFSYDAHFDNHVNTNFSSVHVPTSIYERKDDVLESIGWSSSMDEAFLNNYIHNPTLSYQYFGSSNGFLRHYPAMKWPNDNSDRQNPDLYDCRTRPWYVEAANSPKNMFILHDVSGSMTGIRREIAKHVVNTLLDTLTENDFVNVYNFSDTTSPVVPCLKNRLVQANLENIRELKVGLEQDHTSGIANFTSALNVAFNVLEHARAQKDSANCNQAIMIITDGAPFHFEEIFKARQNPEHYVRVFTYLIGREVTEKREVLWMACANRGYFTHVSTLSEVQEKVLKYMPVMSRPMVILKNHEESWTPVYAHIADTRQTDWSWLDHNAKEQFKRSHRYKELLRMLQESRPLQRPGEESISYYEFQRRVKEFMGVQSYDLHASTQPEPRPREEEDHHYDDYEHDHSLTPPQTRGPPPEDEDYIRRKRNVMEHFLRANDTDEHTNAAHLVPLTNHTNTDAGSPLALPISAKKLEARLKKVHGVASSNDKFFKSQKEEHFPTPAKPKDPTEPFDFIISVSTPVFDNRNSTITYETVRVNASYTFEKPVEERIAIFLGVAGTDIPIKELKKMASPFKLGVNGYAFMINNNGYVVFHPDWRPVFNGELLKPNYNTVDLTEVELIDRDDNFRNNDSSLLEMRKDMIDEERAYKKGLRVRVAQDNFTEFAVDDVVRDENDYVPRYKLRVRKMQDHFRRVTTRRQVYEFHKLRNTPYTLAIATPENPHRFIGELELRLLVQDPNEKIDSYFDSPNDSRKWKINPDWSYCDFVKGGEKHGFTSPEDQLMYFLRKIQTQKSSWPWKNTGEGIKQRHAGHHGGGGGESRWHLMDHEIYRCEKELVQSLVFDANVTKIFSEMNLWKFNKNDKDLLKMNGVTSAFLATRTGLTRWMDFEPSTDGPDANSGTTKEDTMRFIDANSGATNELWYKRAVERYQYDPESFVYSVPFDAGSRNDSHVTATRAIFVKKNGMQAPVAVVGVQFSHKKWMERFFDITKGAFDTRNQSPEGPKWSCDSGAYDCFVLDDNGFIMITENHQDTGKFFGEVDGMVMEMLVNSDVYKRVRVVDYQAVCYQPVFKSNFASMLRTPLAHLSGILNWFVAQIAWVLLNLNLHSYFNPDFSSVLASAAEELPHQVVEEDIGYTLPPYIELASINKTRLRPCDKETFLYTYGASYNTHNFSYHGLLTKCGHSGCDGYFNVHYIPHTNLILVVTDGKCRCGLNSTTIKQREVQYGSVFKKPEHEVEEEDDLLSTSPVEVCRTPKPSLYRKRPQLCINYNAEEEYLREDCGSASTLHTPNLLITLTFLTSSLKLLL